MSEHLKYFLEIIKRPSLRTIHNCLFVFIDTSFSYLLLNNNVSTSRCVIQICCFKLFAYISTFPKILSLENFFLSIFTFRQTFVYLFSCNFSAYGWINIFLNNGKETPFTLSNLLEKKIIFFNLCESAILRNYKKNKIAQCYLNWTDHYRSLTVLFQKHLQNCVKQDHMKCYC